MNQQAIGLVETYGFLTAVEAADTCLKAAKVSFLCCQKIGGGMVTIKIAGDVGAVQAAIKAAGAAANKVGKLIGTHVIPRPVPNIENLFFPEVNMKSPFSISGTTAKATEQVETPCLYKTEQELKEMKTVELRALARKLPGIGIERRAIKFARKEELIEAILIVYKDQYPG
ncbi:MAG: BMC domain-containing protein [Clostridiales bacterium]|nr:BMC domain-containing protein [Clostridiales bacterium]